MIITIKDFINEQLNTFNINDIKYDTDLYENVLSLGFTDNTSDLQHKRGVLEFKSINSNTYRRYYTKKIFESYLKFTIYPNGKLRTTYNNDQHITYDLNHDIESIEDLNILLEKIIISFNRRNK